MKCPLCDCYPTIFLLKADLREYWSCPKCGLVFIPPQFFISKKAEVKRYLEHDNNLDNEKYVSMFQEKINIIKKVCPKINTVLDYGCGYEPVLKTLLEREGYQAHGYDLNFFPNEQHHENQASHFILCTLAECAMGRRPTRHPLMEICNGKLCVLLPCHWNRWHDLSRVR